MPFDPDAYLATAPGAAPAGGFNPDAYLSGGAQPAPAQPSIGEAVARGAVQGATFGFADEGQAALQALFSGKPGTLMDRYTAERDRIRGEYKAAQEAHPIAYGLSELGGGVLAPVPGGAAKTVLGAAAKGALQGGLGALGSSEADLARGEYARAGLDVAKGAGVGAALGGALHKVGEKLSKGAEDRYVSDVATDTVGRARPKDQLQARRLFLADKGDANVSARDVLFSKDVEPIIGAARAGKTAEARGMIAEKLDELRPARDADYATIDRHVGGARVGSVLDGFDNEIARLRTETGNAATVKVLQAVRKDIEDTWSGTQVGMVRSALRGALETAADHERPAIEAAIKELPRSGSLTGKAVQELDVPAAAKRLLDKLPKEPDPNIRVPTVDLRHAVTRAQQSAVEALGTIAETEHARLREAGKLVLEDALKSHLDDAAAKGGEVAKAVQAIRDRDKWFSTLLAMDKGLEQRAGKELLKKKTLAETVQGALTMHGPMAAVPLALAGHIPAAVGAAALPFAIKAGGAAARGGNDMIARLLYAASKGDARAVRLLEQAKKVPGVAARIAGERSAGP